MGGAHPPTRAHPRSDCWSPVRSVQAGEAPGRDAVVTVTGDLLFVQGLNEPKLPLLVESETRFQSTATTTGIEFVNVSNGCATGGSALAMADRAIRSGAYDVGMAIGFDKHPAGAFNADPAEYGLQPWYGEAGLMLTTQFFAMKIQRYLHEHGHGGRA